MGIKAAAFDYGKVISFPPDHGVMDELAAMAGVKRDDLESLVWEFRGEYDRGLLNGREYYRKILEHLGVKPPEGALEKMAEIDMYSWKRVNPETVKLMEELKKAGVLVAILSNMPHDFLAWARKTIPVFSLPHVGIFSCEAFSIKPEEAIYRKLLAALGCRGEEVVFFDDIPENVNKARELKINAFLWKDPENARQELAGLGVRL
jgi:putative hydrolase of the HAD superfamily